MTTVRVKVCGITREDDAITAVEAGVDALGFVVESPGTPRDLDLRRAATLMASVSPYVQRVAVTICRDPATLARICDELRPDALQAHGVPKAVLKSIRSTRPTLRIIRPIHVESADAERDAKICLDEVDAVLADSGNAPIGGTGRSHDWRLSARIRKAIHPKPMILAGGLTPENVADAVRRVRPYGVDVSSGVEARKGVKDRQKVRRFISRAKGASS